MKAPSFIVTIDDCRVDTFTVSGPGGGGKDTSNTGVRITHPPSKAVGIATDHRQQSKNKQLAFGRMARSEAFQKWARIEASRISTGKTIDQIVDEQMAPKNLYVEVKAGNGTWIPETK